MADNKTTAAAKTVKVPRLVYQEIDVGEFAKECAKMVPAAKPRYGIGDVVWLKTSFGGTTPGVICSVESRNADVWHYSVIRPRGIDGILERFGGLNETEIVGLV